MHREWLDRVNAGISMVRDFDNGVLSRGGLGLAAAGSLLLYLLDHADQAALERAEWLPRILSALSIYWTAVCLLVLRLAGQPRRGPGFETVQQPYRPESFFIVTRLATVLLLGYLAKGLNGRLGYLLFAALVSTEALSFVFVDVPRHVGRLRAFFNFNPLLVTAFGGALHSSAILRAGVSVGWLATGGVDTLASNDGVGIRFVLACATLFGALQFGLKHILEFNRREEAALLKIREGILRDELTVREIEKEYGKVFLPKRPEPFVMKWPQRTRQRNSRPRPR